MNRIVTVLASVALLLSLVASPAAAAPPTGGTSPVIWFMDPDHPLGEVVPGATTTLLRTDSGVALQVQTSMLDAGAAYTVWAVVFNHPEKCATPNQCGEPDVFGAAAHVDAVGTSLIFAAGHVLGAGGVGNFGGHLRAGDTSGCQAVFAELGLNLCHGGVTNPRGAEIHLVIRSHGSPIPGRVARQIGSFDGGCRPFEPDGNVCTDKQASIHSPGN